jgi:hypothetical protein
LVGIFSGSVVSKYMTPATGNSVTIQEFTAIHLNLNPSDLFLQRVIHRSQILEKSALGLEEGTHSLEQSGSEALYWFRSVLNSRSCPGTRLSYPASHRSWFADGFW